MRMLKRCVGVFQITMLAGIACLAGCHSPQHSKTAIGVAFETLQTEYWVASHNGIEKELRSHGAELIPAIADGDAIRQFEQVRGFLSREVDGIIVVPKDAETVIPMIAAANEARVPIVLYNRPPDKNSGKSVSIVAENYAITKSVVEAIAALAMKSGGRQKAAVLMGDLSDINALERRNGFLDALQPYGDKFEIVARIPTDWNSEKALAGITSALQAHPDISFIYSSSDLLLPAVRSALKGVGKYKKVGEPGHVFLGSFDGDRTAYRMLTEGYLDADGVQDVDFETQAAVQAVLDLKAGKQVPELILDKGIVVTTSNLKEVGPRMWGARAEADH
jgi:ABC-type sugar transport system substrate-binding protein